MVHSVTGPASAVLRSLGHNWGLALLSLALATALWLYVSEQERTTRTGFLPDTIAVKAVNQPEGLATALSQQVRVRISATEEEWDRLKGADFQAVVDLKGLGPGQHEIPVTVRPPSRQVRVTEVIPDRVQVELSPEAARTVPVQVELVAQPPLGFEAGTAKITPQQVTVRGPEEAVGRTEMAVAEVRLTGVTVDLRRAVELVPRSARGATITGVTLSPEQAQVEVPVLQRSFSRSLSIVPALKGSPAPGYRVTNITAVPPSVTVTAPLAILEGLTAVLTEEVDVSGATAEVVREARLRLPSGATASGQPSTVVRVQVVASPGETTLSVAPRTVGLSRGLSIGSITNAVSVRMGGAQPDLLKLLPRDITVTVNLEGLGPGAYSLEPQVQPPSGVQVLELSPGRVEVTLQ
ncbi:MAG TPA: CdaR family protein [Dehalococcoidia bacterium]|nr:CdaR family protein [Dehalococcoidia bacterium]